MGGDGLINMASDFAMLGLSFQASIHVIVELMPVCMEVTRLDGELSEHNSAVSSVKRLTSGTREGRSFKKVRKGVDPVLTSVEHQTLQVRDRTRKEGHEQFDDGTTNMTTATAELDHVQER